MTETPREHEETNITNPVGKVENFVSKALCTTISLAAVSGGGSGNFWTLATLRYRFKLVKPTRIFAFISSMSPVALLLFWGSWRLTVKHCRP